MNRVFEVAPWQIMHKRNQRAPEGTLHRQSRNGFQKLWNDLQHSKLLNATDHDRTIHGFWIGWHEFLGLTSSQCLSVISIRLEGSQQFHRRSRTWSPARHRRASLLPQGSGSRPRLIQLSGQDVFELGEFDNSRSAHPLELKSSIILHVLLNSTNSRILISITSRVSALRDLCARALLSRP